MRREVLICLLLAGITLGLYWPVGHLGFIDYDDPAYILSNPPVREGISPESIWWAFTSAHASNWHPVTWLSLALDCQLFGLNPGAFHWENVAWHTASALLLFFLLRKMMWLRGEATATQAQAVWRSALVAALFAWHPAHLQSVVWISERKDVLSGFFMLLSLLAYVRYAEDEGRRSEGGGRKPEGGGQKPFSVFYLLSLGCFALGLMSKPMLVTLPLILLLLDYWPLGRFAIGQSSVVSRQSSFTIPWRLLLEKIPFAILSVASVLATFWAQGTGKDIVSIQKLPLLERMANAPVFVTYYLEKLFWPANLTIYYPYQHIPFWEQAGCGLLVALLTVLCLWRLRSRPAALIGWLWFLIMLLPVIGLVKAGTQSIADRYTYLPSIGLFVSVVWGIGGLLNPSKPWPTASFVIRHSPFVLALALLLACLVDTRWQMQYWRNATTLNQHSLDVCPENNAVSEVAVGCARWREAGDLEGAARNLELALQANSKGTWQMDNAVIHHKLGVVLLSQDKPAEAAAQFEAAIKIAASPADEAYYRKYLGDALAFAGKTDEAEKEYARVEQVLPGDAGLQQQIAASRALAGLRETLKTGPSPEIYSQLAGNEASQGLARDALEHYQAALKLAPDSPQILNNLAWLLTTCLDNKVRDGNRAVQYAQRACELTQYGQAVFMGTLAAAYAEAGKFDDAVATAQKACAAAARAGEDRLLQQNQELLKAYRAHQTALQVQG